MVKVEVLEGQPFLFDADGVNNVGACNKACYIAMSWLLNKTCYESQDGTVVLEHTMPDGSVRQFAMMEGPDGKVTHFPLTACEE